MQVRNVEFADTLDSDEEIEVTIGVNGYETYAWVDRDAAVFIIHHLKKVFNLNGLCIVCMHKECLCDNGPNYV